MHQVLIVDDEPFILEGLSNLVNWEDYGLSLVGVAANGREALEMIEMHSVQILITDLKMPTMDGLSLMRIIKEKNYPIKCIVLSGFNDFTYVKEAAKLGIENYLLKPINEQEFTTTLVNTVDKINMEAHKNQEINEGYRILRRNTIQRWIVGDIDKGELLERSKMLNIDMSKRYIVAVIHLLESTESVDPFSGDENLLYFSAQNICQQTLSDENLGEVVQDFYKHVLAVFTIEDEKADMSKIEFALEKCKEEIAHFLKRKSLITVGDMPQQYQSVSSSYNNAMKLQEYRMMYSPNQTVYYSKHIRQKPESIHSMKEYMALLESISLQNDYETIATEIDKFFHSLAKRPIVEPSLIRYVTTELLLTYMNTTKISSELYSMDELEDLFPVISKFDTVTSLSKWIKATMAELHAASQLTLGTYCPIVTRAIDYLNENFYKDINLKSVATDLKTNAFYLGQLFRNDVKESFTDYLNKLRIDEAKRLIKKTNKRTADIARMVGYQNACYFYTIFRNIQGVPPLNIEARL